jgi:enoyl-CoA hydratase/carnithine racemase
MTTSTTIVLPELELDISHGIARLTLNRPATRNALGLNFSRNLLQALDQIELKSSVDAVLLTANGAVFCGGGDLSELMSTETVDVEVQYEMAKGFNKAIARLFHFDRPIIAAINGPAYGGGVALGLAADFAFAAEGAAYHFAFGRIGLSGAEMGVSTLLQRAIGPHRAAFYLQTGGVINSTVGKELGLFIDVVPQADLLARSHAAAELLTRQSRRAVTITKMALRRAQDVPFQTALDYESYMQTLALGTNEHKRRLGALQSRLAQ